MFELYHAESCPYCVKVREFLENEGVAYISKPVSLIKTSPLKEEMKQLGGKAQVPFLNDPGHKAMLYESDDIIDYVRRHYVRRNP
jgi:glutathione S-transferase